MQEWDNEYEEGEDVCPSCGTPFRKWFENEEGYLECPNCGLVDNED